MDSSIPPEPQNFAIPIQKPYRGRFAPSPTGSLHFGSLVAATGSYLEARHQQGTWLVRMEDLDTARCSSQHSDDILFTLDALGFQWDGEVLKQSERKDIYREAFEALRLKGQLYPCACSRKEIADSTHFGGAEQIYPGTCRNGIKKGRSPRSHRIRVNDALIRFNDLLQGSVHQQLSHTVGDFVIQRADGFYAYQLTVVVDDAFQGITDVVRGSDLLDSTARQIYLQKQLHFVTPRYAHLPVVINHQGEKLSKQTLAPAVNKKNGALELFKALQFLGQNPPQSLMNAPVSALWDWAIPHWERHKVPKQPALFIESTN